MLAILVQQGTKYDCNDNNNGDLIWMQSRFPRRLNMLAILFNTDQISMQSSKICFREIRPEIIRDSRTIFNIASISGPQ